MLSDDTPGKTKTDKGVLPSDDTLGKTETDKGVLPSDDTLGKTETDKGVMPSDDTLGKTEIDKGVMPLEHVPKEIDLLEETKTVKSVKSAFTTIRSREQESKTSRFKHIVNAQQGMYLKPLRHDALSKNKRDALMHSLQAKLKSYPKLQPDEL